MMFRLVRIQGLLLGFTSLAALVALWTGATRPLGITIGGGAAWVDFVVIRRLATAMLSRKPAPSGHIVPMALAKSVLLIGLPAIALFLPSSIVDGVSFALGVTALPAAVVADALLPLQRSAWKREA
jgi:hypothetical protein